METTENNQETSLYDLAMLVFSLLFVKGEMSQSNIISTLQIENSALQSAIEYLTEHLGKYTPLCLLINGDHYRLAVKLEYGDRLPLPIKAPRTSVAARIVLCTIAYNQPISLSLIEKMRGGTSSWAILDKLTSSGFIKTIKGQNTQQTLYVTTQKFLDHFNLRSLSDLPQLSMLMNVDSVEDLRLPPQRRPLL